MPSKIKPKRSYTANAVPTTSDLETNELAIRWDAASPAMFTKNAAGNIVSVTLGGGGGSGSIVTAATVSGFPASGSASNLYITTEDQRIWRWDATASIYVESGPIGGGFALASVPASATATGSTGQIAADGSHWYYCSAPNTWVRTALSTWAPFGPNSVSGLQAWYDASDASTLFGATSGGSLVAANGAVARWEDKSGNGRHATQATSGFRPVRKTAQQNGLGALEFSASSNQRLAVSGSADTLKFLHGSAYTLFVVCKIGTASATNALNPVVSTMTTLSGLPGMAIYHDDRSAIPRSNNIGINVNQETDSGALLSFVSGDSFFSAGAFGVLSMTGNMTSGTAAGKATMRNTANESRSPLSATGSASASNSQADFTIGAVSEQFWLNGQMAEIIIYNSVLSSTDRDAVRGYLMSKWGIA